MASCNHVELSTLQTRGRKQQPLSWNIPYEVATKTLLRLTVLLNLGTLDLGLVDIGAVGMMTC